MPAGLVVGRSAIEGRGVFAGRHIAAGEPFHWMDGDRVSLIRCGWRILLGQLRFDDPLQIGPLSFIDLDSFSININSSCDPSAAIRKRNEMFALRDIAPGDEITFDYAMTVLPSPFNRSWRMPCRCRSAICRGMIGNMDTVPLERLAYYASKGAIQAHMMPALKQRLGAHGGQTDETSSKAA